MVSSSPVSSDERTLGRALTLFAILQALAALYEMHGALLRVWHVTNPVTVSQTIVFLAAAWLLLRPASLSRLLSFCAIDAAKILVMLPRTPNHWILALVIDATLLLSFARLAFAGEASRAALYRVAAPLVRLEVVALYGWTVFHKLNVDFLDRDVSCAAVQLFRLRHGFPFLPVDAWVREAAIYGTLVIEAVIPALLIVRRTRVAGVLLGSAFHFVLGFLYPGFSANLFAWLSLFLTAAAIDGVPDARALGRRLGAGLLAGLVVYGILEFALGGVRLPAAGVGWLLYGSCWLALLAPASWPLPPPSGVEPAFAFRYRALLLLPALVFLNGLNPYLGLKNVQSFSMFSNLRTEGGRSNHLIVPGSWQPADFQRDLVTILSSSDSVLMELTERRRYIHFFSTAVHPTGHPALDGPPPAWRLPYAALRARVTHYKREGRADLQIRYERGGTVHSVERAETDPELARFPRLLDKFFLLRAVPDGERGLCMW